MDGGLAQLSGRGRRYAAHGAFVLLRRRTGVVRQHHRRILCVYQQYQDRTILEENYPAMQKWLDFFEKHCKNGNLFDTWPNTDRQKLVSWRLGRAERRRSGVRTLRKTRQ